MKKIILPVIAAVGLSLALVGNASALPHRWCRHNVQATTTQTSCAMADAVVAAWNTCNSGFHCTRWVRSPLNHRWFRMVYVYHWDGQLMTADWITAKGPYGIWVRFI